MAIDTAEKRRSVAAIPYGWAGASVTPTLSKDAEWRQEVGWSYAGIAAATVSIAAILVDLTTLWMGEYLPELKAAHIAALDVDTLIRDDLSTVIAFVNEEDRNTLYAVYLSST